MTETELEDDSQSPGFQFAVGFQSMHDLNDKLLAINYSKQFVQQFKCPPINRYFFCRQTNSAQQFYTFSCLSSFLLNQLNPNVVINVEDFEDPNLTIDTIINASNDFIDISFYNNNRNKFKVGFGQEIINFLNDLINKVINNYNNNNINTNSNGIVIKGFDETNDEDINEDINSDEVNAILLEEEQYDYNLIDDKPQEDEDIDQKKDNQIMKSECDINEWKIEVERVLPQLRVKMINKSAENEWRNHYNSVSVNHLNMKSLCEQTFTSIQTLLNELRLNDDKINSREKYLKQQLEHILEEWIAIRLRVIKMRDEYSSVSSGVVLKSSQLAELSQLIETMKQDMELFSNKMTDSSPLIVAKRAKDNLKQELNSIELRIGVAIQTLIINNK
jgi:estrogen-related receptor beta like 1